ncbi:unnamed protein product [Parnassius mnemosyne]|uniref:Transposase n=1 Tax=Parnassius mnemosyne TaxID=213953 RepID=A0AAV1LFE4_9NEOP
MPKRKCLFSDDYTKEWSFIKRGRNDYEAFCSICGFHISVSHGGKSSVKDHIQSKNHKTKLSVASTSRDISTFMITQCTAEDMLICAAELTTAYKVVKHHQSFSSLDCTTKLNAVMYPDSSIAAKQSTARTKATAIIKHILAPHSIAQIKTEVEKVPFYGISTDSSNHKAEKLFPLLIQYFTEKEGLQIKLLKIDSLPNETSDTITSFCIKSLQDQNIPVQNIVAFSGDNTNTNFGGRDRYGVNNVFFKLKEILSKDIEGIGCPAHILHNTESTAADVMSIDVESIVLKIFKYFSIFTVRVERLKDFCEQAALEYNNILSHSRSRWLSLLPAIERILKLWLPLKEFFAKEAKAPKAVVDFFADPLSEVYTLFVHSQAFLIEKQIKKIEKSVITIVEVKNVLQDTKKQLSDRLINKYLGNQTTQLYNKLKNEGTINTSQSETFDKETGDFFNTAICYLEQWTEPMTKFDVFAWMILNDIPQWQQVEETTKHLNEKDIGIDDSMYEEFMYLKSFIECEISDEWKAKNMEAKWKHFFEKTEELERKANLLKMCQYIFAIPGHNAHVERVFSLISAQWTKERSSLSVSTIESIIQCVYNYKMSCTEFYNYVKGEKELLKKVKSTEKYEWAKKKDVV